MKKNRLIFLFIVSLFIGTLFTGCDDNIPKYDNVKVERVEWNEDLKMGVEIEIGYELLKVADRLTVFPENATDKMQTFSSSDSEVAIVDARGLVKTNSVGTTTITVTVDGKSDEFTLTVTEKAVIEVTEIQIAAPDIEIMAGVKRDLSIEVTVLPDNAVDKSLSYTSADPATVQVDEKGIIKALKIGTTKVTVSSNDVPTIKGEFNITVKEFEGDYPREGWTLTASQNPLFNESPNSLTSPLDGDLATWMGLVKPGKTHTTITVPPAAQGGNIYFIVDMKESRDVNYFRIYHRNGTDVLLRYYMIEEISGSDDGINFTPIATNVVIPDAAKAEVMETPNLSIPKTKYRYLKFFCSKDACFNSAGTRGSVQFAEIYIGLKK
ncbi:Ig-like domain-containing protein [Dysgonomonas sp. BGC7]|uniref:Ig-like domain-containing protein n=1 Tax=Dysgonomonas sp. BGC7 TaxID=1658008 RepID=UPI000681BA27|nr:Ig-like domain-containing protein [Dysgonomonas sp. BGC7]MBD8390318.1 Ig-like domain-containing protein [Dysgonomonas sp. BGC7]